jgi:hypothetical protein
MPMDAEKKWIEMYCPELIQFLQTTLSRSGVGRPYIELTLELAGFSVIEFFFHFIPAPP